MNTHDSRGNGAPAGPARVVCILGMHRSGTSLVARVASFLGVDLGSEARWIKAAPDNPKGFFEHRGFLQLNQRLLGRAGGSWRRVPPLPPGWERAPALEDARMRARALIEEFAGSPVWGWKDPRTCLTLPFWQQLLDPLHYVICVRHPIAVARSLERRDGLPFEKGVSLWLTYLGHALSHTDGTRRTFIVYEDLVRDFRPSLERIAGLLAAPDLAARSDIQENVAAFVDRCLQHNDAHFDGTEPEWLGSVQRVYASLARARAPAPAEFSTALAALRPVIAEIERIEYARWINERETVRSEIVRLVPADEVLILVDDGQWALDDAELGRRQLPFLERDGCDWGPPPNDETAIAELERMRQGGIKFIAFAAPSFWWFSHYSSFHGHLRSRARRVSECPQLVLFELE